MGWTFKNTEKQPLSTKNVKANSLVCPIRDTAYKYFSKNVPVYSLLGRIIPDVVNSVEFLGKMQDPTGYEKLSINAFF